MQIICDSPTRHTWSLVKCEMTGFANLNFIPAEGLEFIRGYCDTHHFLLPNKVILYSSFSNEYDLGKLIIRTPENHPGVQYKGEDYLEFHNINQVGMMFQRWEKLSTFSYNS